MTDSPGPEEPTRLLRSIPAGGSADPDAVARMFSLVYDGLRNMARRFLARGVAGR